MPAPPLRLRPRFHRTQGTPACSGTRTEADPSTSPDGVYSQAKVIIPNIPQLQVKYIDVVFKQPQPFAGLQTYKLDLEGCVIVGDMCMPFPGEMHKTFIDGHFVSLGSDQGSMFISRFRESFINQVLKIHWCPDQNYFLPSIFGKLLEPLRHHATVLSSEAVLASITGTFVKKTGRFVCTENPHCTTKQATKVAAEVMECAAAAEGRAEAAEGRATAAERRAAAAEGRSVTAEERAAAAEAKAAAVVAATATATKIRSLEEARYAAAAEAAAAKEAATAKVEEAATAKLDEAAAKVEAAATKVEAAAAKLEAARRGEEAVAAREAARGAVGATEQQVAAEAAVPEAGRWMEETAEVEAAEKAAEVEAAEKAAEAVAAADGVARELSSSVAGDHLGDGAIAETAGAVAANADRCASAAEARVAEAQVMEAKRVAEERAGAAEETAEAAQLQIEQLREADGNEGRWQRMSPWATGAVGLLIRLRMSSFVFATSVLAGASALAALSITSFAFLALSCLRFNIIAVPYGVFPNVVSPFV